VIALLLAAAQSLPQGPVDFSAHDLRMEMKDHRVLFLDGDVRLNRGGLLVTGDHAVADLANEQQKPKPAKGKQKQVAQAQSQAIDKFTIDGNVHVQRGTRTADGAHGVVDMPAQTLVLTGTEQEPPVLRDGTEQLSGDRILMHIDSEDVEVQKPHLLLHRSLPEGAEKKGAPQAVRVEAEHMDLHQAQRLARFTDDVVVRRADMVAKSPKMDARYDADGQLTTLQMRGGVDLRQGQRRATGQTADYDARLRKMVLLGDPKLYDRGDVLAGDRIELSLDTSEVHVEKGKGHLRPDIHKNEAQP
jgi:lipopolysaccharide transport protein LptA